MSLFDRKQFYQNLVDLIFNFWKNQLTFNKFNRFDMLFTNDIIRQKENSLAHSSL